MFLNKTMFKKWIKNAYGHQGLTVGRIYGGLVVSGVNWIVWTRDGYIPNWLKAAIIEYAGELPKEGTVFQAKKDEVPQYEMSENPYLNLPERFREANVPFQVLPIIYDTKWSRYRLVQCRSSGEIIPLPSGYYDIIDVREIEGSESYPVGPASRDERGGILIWKNEISALAVTRGEMSESGFPVLKALRGLEYEEVPL